MGFKKIKIRNNANTLTNVVITILIIMGIYFGSFLFVSSNISSANLTLDSKYNSTYGNLTAAQDELNTTVGMIYDSAQGIGEATSVWQVAWNGLKGLGATLKLPLDFIGSSIKVFFAFITPLDILPSWVITLALIGITTFIVFLVLKILKGEPNM